MKFGAKQTIEATEISHTLANRIYLVERNQAQEYIETFHKLKKVCSVFANRLSLHKETANREFTCYIEQQAFDAFIRFADETYNHNRHEATGLIVGHYLHDKGTPNSKFIVGTNFLAAKTGNTTTATCEFSYEDSIEHSDFYNANKLLPLIWIHSHPGFGAFYSATDDSTLKNYFYANHQIGVVVDNINKKFLGYKIYNGKRQEEDVFIFDLEKSTPTELKLINICYRNRKNVEHKTNIVHTPKVDDGKKGVKPGKGLLINVIGTLLLFVVVGVALVANFKRTNDLEKRIIEITQQVDSINNIVATQKIIEEINEITPELSTEIIDIFSETIENEFEEIRNPEKQQSKITPIAQISETVTEKDTEQKTKEKAADDTITPKNDK